MSAVKVGDMLEYSGRALHYVCKCIKVRTVTRIDVEITEVYRDEVQPYYTVGIIRPNMPWDIFIKHKPIKRLLEKHKCI